MFNALLPVLKSVNEDGVEIDATTVVPDEAREVAELLFLAVDALYPRYKRGFVLEAYDQKRTLGFVVNDTVTELIVATRGTMETFERDVDAHGYTVIGYHLSIGGRKYILETGMKFDCEVKFNLWKRLRLMFGKIAEPNYIGSFDYEFKLWVNESTYYSIVIPYRKFTINDTYYIRTLRRYIGIPENDHHEELPFYLRRKYGQRKSYFTNDHS